MVSRKEMARNAIADPTDYSPPPLPASKLPAPLRFPLLAILSLSISLIMYELAADFTGYELASVSRSLNEWRDVLITLGWKIAELAVGWYGKYDDADLRSLTILTHLPFHYFLTTFYGISLRTSLICLAIDVLAIQIPFRLLRPRAAVHNPRAPKAAVPNRNIIHDFSVAAATTLLAAAIYGVIVYGSFASWLPVHLVVNFEGLRSLEYAHDAKLPMIVASCFPLGWAARDFLFTPSTGAQTNLRDIRAEAFNPETATLWQTVAHNLWGWRKRARVLIGRTLTLAVLTGINTWIHTYWTIEGSEGWGAAGWAGVWVLASLATGAMYGWVGAV